MTARAATCDPRMIVRSPQERGRGFVTVLTGGARCDVTCRFCHDPSDPAHACRMAGGAAGDNPRVVHRSPRKCRRGLMAVLARGGGWEVIRRLAQRRGAVMTARAVGRNATVIVIGIHENPVAPHPVTSITRCGSD
jgi:hypothetical protein